VRVALGVLVAGVALACAAAAAGAERPVVVVDPGHDARANPETEPIGPGATTRKI
jgi:hypothetical protein